MSSLTFEQLPQAVYEIQQKLASIEQLLLQLNKASPESDAILTVEEAAKFLNLSVATIYSLISKGELPVMKRSKRCYFSKFELIAYLKKGRRKTNQEIEAEAAEYLLKRKFYKR
ncbi:MAG: helix-turn-helix domain-containing protein [Saprospiraceae bacterium]